MKVSLGIADHPAQAISPEALEFPSWVALVEGFQKAGATPVGTYFCPGVFNGTRCNENFQFADVVAADVDDGVGLDEALSKIKVLGLCAVVYTTKSHQVAKDGVSRDRYRVISPLARQIASKEAFRAATIEYMLLLDLGCDAACKDPARYFALNRNAQWFAFDGSPFSPSEHFVAEEKRAEENVRNGSEIHPAVIFAQGLIAMAKDGEQNNVINAQAFKLAKKLAAGELAGVTEALLRNQLLAAAIQGGHPHDRAVSAINSGLEKGLKVFISSATRMRSAGEMNHPELHFISPADPFRGGGKGNEAGQQNETIIVENWNAWKQEPNVLPRQIVVGLLDVGDKAVLVGASKVGKTWLALDLACSISAGKPWQGFQVTRPHKVLICQMEVQRNHFRFRLQTFLDARKIDVGANLLVVNGRGKVTALAALYSAVKSQGVEVVVLDPIYKLLEGDENKAEDVKPFLAEIDRFCEELGCAVILVHHAAKGRSGDRQAVDRAAGSGVIARDMDVMISLDAHKDGQDATGCPLFVLEVINRNYGKPENLSLRRNGAVYEIIPDLPAEVATSATRQQQKQGTCSAEFAAQSLLKALPCNQGDALQILCDFGISRQPAKTALDAAVLKGYLRSWQAKGKGAAKMFDVGATSIPQDQIKITVPA